jgi:hypothetical protein
VAVCFCTLFSSKKYESRVLVSVLSHSTLCRSEEEHQGLSHCVILKGHCKTGASDKLNGTNSEIEEREKLFCIKLIGPELDPKSQNFL